MEKAKIFLTIFIVIAILSGTFGSERNVQPKNLDTHTSGTISTSSFAMLDTFRIVSISASPSVICKGSSSQLQVVPAGGNGIYVYLWSGAGLNSTFIANPVATPTVTTTYSVQAISNGETKTASVIVTVNAPATANAGADITVCNTANATLSGNFGGAATSAIWSGGLGIFTPNASSMTAIYDPSAAEIAARSVTLTLTTNDPAGVCNAASDRMVVKINPIATVNAGADRTLCGTNTAYLSATVGGGATTATWSGGSGFFAPSTTILNPTYTASAAEITAGSVTLTLTTNNPAGPCPSGIDYIVIKLDNSAPATANAGVDITVCNTANASLSGSFGGTATSASWTGGLGIFTPNRNTLNAVYDPTGLEIAAKTVTLTLTTNDPAGSCMPASDVVVVKINPIATANAGIDQTRCGTGNTTLSATIGGGATSATWSGGLGNFSPGNTTMNAVYTPAASEITAGSISLTLITNNPAGPCPSASDKMVIIIDNVTPPATAKAGVDITVCNTANATLAGSFGGSATSASWSGGLGIFTPNRTTLTAVYDPSAAEIAARSATLTLNTSGSVGGCSSVTDNVVVKINPAATVNAGVDISICANQFPAQLSGVIGGGANAATWSGGLGVYNPGNISLNASYTATAAEIMAGSVTFTLTTDNPTGPCPSASDKMVMVFYYGPTANAGVDQTVCSNNPISLPCDTSQGHWSGSAGISSCSYCSLPPCRWSPTTAEVMSGSLTLTYTTADPPGPCGPISDQIVIRFTPAPFANAGPDQTVLSGSQVTLAGSIGYAANGIWIGGNGVFSPSNSSLNALYLPSAAEFNAGSVTLSLYTAGNGTCLSVSDNVKIKFNFAKAAEDHQPDAIESIDSDDINTWVTMYPNPTKGLLNLEFNSEKQNVEIQILNALGKVVFEEKKSGIQPSVRKIIDLQSQANGVYQIRVQSGGKTWSNRFVLMK